MIFLACWWGRFIDWLEGHEPSAQVFAALAMLAVTVGLVIATFLYAKSARRQAKASAKMADATLRPVMLLWTAPKPAADLGDWHAYTVWYANIGSGPAINISFRLDPVHGSWSEPPSWSEPTERVGMGVQDCESRIQVRVAPSTPDEVFVVAEYHDASSSRWMTTLRLEKEDGVLRNRESKVGPIPERTEHDP